jgi:hypothetical protein
LDSKQLLEQRVLQLIQLALSSLTGLLLAVTVGKLAAYDPTQPLVDWNQWQNVSLPFTGGMVLSFARGFTLGCVWIGEELLLFVITRFIRL